MPPPAGYVLDNPETSTASSLPDLKKEAAKRKPAVLFGQDADNSGDFPQTGYVPPPLERSVWPGEEETDSTTPTPMTLDQARSWKSALNPVMNVIRPVAEFGRAVNQTVGIGDPREEIPKQWRNLKEHPVEAIGSYIPLKRVADMVYGEGKRISGELGEAAKAAPDSLAAAASHLISAVPLVGPALDTAVEAAQARGMNAPGKSYLENLKIAATTPGTLGTTVGTAAQLGAAAIGSYDALKNHLGTRLPRIKTPGEVIPPEGEPGELPAPPQTIEGVITPAGGPEPGSPGGTGQGGLPAPGTPPRPPRGPAPQLPPPSTPIPAESLGETETGASGGGGTPTTETPEPEAPRGYATGGALQPEEGVQTQTQPEQGKQVQVLEEDILDRITRHQEVADAVRADLESMGLGTDDIGHIIETIRQEGTAAFDRGDVKAALEAAHHQLLLESQVSAPGENQWARGGAPGGAETPEGTAIVPRGTSAPTVRPEAAPAAETPPEAPAVTPPAPAPAELPPSSPAEAAVAEAVAEPVPAPAPEPVGGYVAGIAKKIGRGRKKKEDAGQIPIPFEGAPVPVPTPVKQLLGEPQEETKQKIADTVGGWVKRAAMDQQGQDILDDMIENKEKPNEIEQTFWRDTYFKLPGNVQRRFQKMLHAISGLKPGDAIAVDPTGKPIIAETWMDIADHPKFGSQLSDDPENLEGTERGYAVLMREANRAMAGVPAKTAAAPTAQVSAPVPAPPAPAQPEPVAEAPKLTRVKGEPVPTWRVSDTGVQITLKGHSYDVTDSGGQHVGWASTLDEAKAVAAKQGSRRAVPYQFTGAEDTGRRDRHYEGGGPAEVWRVHTDAGDIDVYVHPGQGQQGAMNEAAKLLGQNLGMGVSPDKLFNRGTYKPTPEIQEREKQFRMDRGAVSPVTPAPVSRRNRSNVVLRETQPGATTHQIKVYRNVTEMTQAKQELKVVEQDIRDLQASTGQLSGSTSVSVIHGLRQGLNELGQKQRLLQKQIELLKREREALYADNPNVGEVRLDADGIPMLWLNSAAMELIQHVMRGSGTPFGTDLTKEEARWLRREIAAAHPTDPKQQAVPQPVVRLLDAALAHAGDPGITVAGKMGLGIHATAQTLSHELHHRQQRVRADGSNKPLVSPSAFTSLFSALPEGGHSYFRDHGYEHDGDGSVELVVVEAAAHIMADQWEKIGLTSDQAAAWLRQYYDEMIKQHGTPQAVAEIKHVYGVAREIQKEVEAQYGAGEAGEPAAGPKEDLDTGGTVPSVSGRGRSEAQVDAGKPAVQDQVTPPSRMDMEQPGEQPDKDDWLKRSAKQFVSRSGGQYHKAPAGTRDARAMDIANAYAAMKHDPENPAVKASYDAFKIDIDKQWDHAIESGVFFEPWEDKNSQPYANSAEMKADVEKNHHLYFFRGGEMPTDHPLAEVDPKTGFTYNDKLRAVHDLYGHAVHGWQFGERGEENAWITHSQMFSREAVPALTTETKGQNNWVNSGPHMRRPDGTLIKKGEEGWLHPSERPFAEQKAGLLPQRYHYRIDAPLSFVSPNTLDIPGVTEAQRQFKSEIHNRFIDQAHALAKDMGLNVVIESALGSWKGGAENSLAIHYPFGTDPELVKYYDTNLGRLAYQYATARFIHDVNGKDSVVSFWVDGKTTDTNKLAATLLSNGIENSTIVPAEDGYNVTLIDTDNALHNNIDKLTSELGVKSVGHNRGIAEFPGDYTNRDAAESGFLQTIEEVESGRPSLREVRRTFESRPDYDVLYRAIREAQELVAPEEASPSPPYTPPEIKFPEAEVPSPDEAHSQRVEDTAQRMIGLHGDARRAAAFAGDHQADYPPNHPNRKFWEDVQNRLSRKPEALSSAIEKANSEYAEFFTPHEIANGHCYEWATIVAKNLPGAKVKDVDLWPHRGKEALPYHVWVDYQGKSYDAETPNGVANWKELPYFKEHTNQAILPKLKARTFPKPKYASEDEDGGGSEDRPPSRFDLGTAKRRAKARKPGGEQDRLRKELRHFNLNGDYGDDGTAALIAPDGKVALGDHHMHLKGDVGYGHYEGNKWEQPFLNDGGVRIRARSGETNVEFGRADADTFQRVRNTIEALPGDDFVVDYQPLATGAGSKFTMGDRNTVLAKLDDWEASGMRPAPAHGSYAAFRNQMEERQPTRFDLGKIDDLKHEAQVRSNITYKDLEPGVPFEQAAYNSKNNFDWEDIERHLLPAEREAYKDNPELQRKYTDAVNMMANQEEFDAALKTGMVGRLWYERSSRAFDALIDTMPESFKKRDKNKFLNFVAALSPVQTVRLNLSMAITMWDRWNKAGRPQDVKWKDKKNYTGVEDKNALLYRIMKGGEEEHVKEKGASLFSDMEPEGKTKKTPGVDLESRLSNSIRALQGQPMSGPKVSAFAPNLGEDEDKSTNDTWMALFANVDPNLVNQKHNYDALSTHVRIAAEKNGVSTRQAQAAIWSFIKTLAEMSGWGKNRWIAPQEVINNNWMTPDLVALHSQDFADLLQNDKVIRGKIAEIGGDLSALDRKLRRRVPERPAVDEGTDAELNKRLLGSANRLEAARERAEEDRAFRRHLKSKMDRKMGIFEVNQHGELFDDERVTSPARPDFNAIKAEAEERRPERMNLERKLGDRSLSAEERNRAIIELRRLRHKQGTVAIK